MPKVVEGGIHKNRRKEHGLPTDDQALTNRKRRKEDMTSALSSKESTPNEAASVAPILKDDLMDDRALLAAGFRGAWLWAQMSTLLRKTHLAGFQKAAALVAAM